MPELYIYLVGKYKNFIAAFRILQNHRHIIVIINRVK